MATAREPEQVDIGGPKPAVNNVDNAIHTVRKFQRADSTLSVTHLQAALKVLTDDQLLYVSMATRVPHGQLKAFRGT